MTASAGKNRRWTNERFDAEITHVTRLGEVVNAHTKVLVRGECGHEWDATPTGLREGTGCAVCNVGEPWTNERFDAEITHVTRIGEVTNSTTPVLVRGECGHEWNASPANLRRGQGCRPCALKAVAANRVNRWTNERFDREITHVTRIGNVTGGKAPVLVRGECGHEWEAAPYNLSKGHGCPVQPCKSASIWKGRSDRWTNERFDREFPHVTRLGDVTGGLATVLVRGECGHEWSPRPTSLSDGHGCPTCTHGERWTDERFDREITHVTRLGEVVNAYTPVLVRGECGHEWSAAPTGLSAGSGCYACNIGEPWTNERFDREITHVTRIGDGSAEKFLVRGECGHEWEATPYNLSKGHGCFVCAIGEPWTNERFDREITHVTRLGEVGNQSTKVLVRGECGHEWSVNPANLSYGKGCPSCAEYGFNPSKPAHIYLMERPGEQQIGITNDPDTRLKSHAREGWALVELIGPIDGQEALDRETAMKRTIRTQFEAVPDTRENWLTTSFEASSIAEVEAAR